MGYIQDFKKYTKTHIQRKKTTYIKLILQNMIASALEYIRKNH